jgi:nitroreductase
MNLGKIGYDEPRQGWHAILKTGGASMKEDFIDLCRSRYSVRSFSDRCVEEEKIQSILAAAQLAPTACNKQPVRIYVLKSKISIDALQKTKMSHFGETLAFIVCYDKDECWIREYDGECSGGIDASIVATHMMLEAWNQGIGSTWIMHFMPEAVTCEFALPDNIVPVCILAMGYPADDAQPSRMHFMKRSLSEIATIM